VAVAKRRAFGTRGWLQNGCTPVVVTDRRVVFTEQGMVRSRLEDFPSDRISSIQTEAGVVFGKLTILPQAQAVIERVGPKERIPEIGDYIRGRLGGAATPVPPAADAIPAAATPMEQLKQLGGLHGAGILTQEEFQARKAALLGRI
jgi:hypothetical protein